MKTLSLVQLPIILCSPDSNPLLLCWSVVAADPNLFPSWILRDSDAVYQDVFFMFVVFLFIFVCQVVLLGMDILSALVSRLQERFRTQVGTGELLHFIFKIILKSENKNNIKILNYYCCYTVFKPVCFKPKIYKYIYKYNLHLKF